MNFAPLVQAVSQLQLFAKGLSQKYEPVAREMFVPLKDGETSDFQPGTMNDVSNAIYVLGRKHIMLEVRGLPMAKWADDETQKFLGGELLIEGTIGGRHWFELCRFQQNGVYNLGAAILWANRASGDKYATHPAYKSPPPGYESASNEVYLNRIRGRVTEMPEGKFVRCFVMAVN